MLASNPFSHTRQSVLFTEVFEFVGGPFAVIQNLFTGNYNPDGSKGCRQKDGEYGNGQNTSPEATPAASGTAPMAAWTVAFGM